MGGEPRLVHQPALDGLRAVAVAVVIAYHLDVSWTPGGFLGVDLFFVLSGYLITALLLAEWDERGRISLREFWGRRFRRLLPALLLVLAVVVPLAALWLPAWELGRIRGDALAALGYVANWRFVASGQSYFDLFATPSPMRHLWSLAIEEQLYLVWPITLVGLLALVGPRRRVLVAAGVVLVAASALWMAASFDPADVSRAYYGTDTRAHGLLLGAVLAMVRWRRAPLTTVTARRALGGAGIAAAAALVAVITLVPDTSHGLYRGGFLAVALLAAVVVAAAVEPETPGVRRWLGGAVLGWIGVRAYGIYLWHWPVIVLLTPARTGLDGWLLDGLRVAVTIGAAALSFWLLEMPIRSRSWSLRRAAPLAVGGFAAVVAIAVVATLGAAPVPVYLGREDPFAATDRNDRPGRTSTTTSGAVGATVPADAAPTSPSPPDAIPAPGPVPGAAPLAPPPPTLTRAILVGDSVATTVGSGLAPALRAQGVDLIDRTSPGCGILRGRPLDDDGVEFAVSQTCDRGVAGHQERAVAAFRPQMVIALGSWDALDRIIDGAHLEVGTEQGDARLAALLDETVARLGAAGAFVVLVTTPAPVQAPEGLGTPDGARRVEAFNRVLRGYVRAASRAVGLVELFPVVCPTGAMTCPASLAGVRLRVDDGIHFSDTGTTWVATRLAPAVLDCWTAGPLACGRVATRRAA